MGQFKDNYDRFMTDFVQTDHLYHKQFCYSSESLWDRRIDQIF